MPDGRVVPICIVHAPRVDKALDAVDPNRLRFPKSAISGGYPVLTTVQRLDRIASLGCLVTDGNKVYALTNRHVVGAPGTPQFTRLGGELVQIGVAAEKQLTKLAFKDAYPGWESKNIVVNADIGLIDITNV